MTGTWAHERREDIRLQCSNEVVVQFRDISTKKSITLTSNTQDISMGGLSFFSAEKIPHNARLIISLKDFGQKIDSQILSVKKDIYSVQFLDFPTRQQLKLKRFLSTIKNHAIDRRLLQRRAEHSSKETEEPRRHSNRRKLSMFDKNARHGDFIFEKTVYLSDTNAFGNTYFSKYVEWQGLAREALLRAIVPNYEVIFSTGVKWITAEVSMRYHHETRVYDDVSIVVHPGEVKRTTLELLFTYLNRKNGTLIGEGRQLLAFAAPTGRLIELPEPLRKGLMPLMSNHRKTSKGSVVPALDFYHYFLNTKGK